MKYFSWVLAWLGLMQGYSAIADTGCDVLVVVGMEDERAIAAGAGVEVVAGTANANRLRERLNQLDISGVKAVFSFGVGGGLDPTLNAGDLLVSERVLSHNGGGSANATDDSWPVDAALLQNALLRARKANLVVRKATFLGTDREAREQSAETVTGLYRATGAQLIDNETHIAAQFASEHGLPFLSIRVVSDSVHTPLPPAALLPLNPDDGSPDLAAIAKSLLSHPSQIPTLVRTALEYRKALSALREFRDKVGFGIASQGSAACDRPM